MLGILVFVRLTFYIFHVMFPAYAMRVFGDDFPLQHFGYSILR